MSETIDARFILKRRNHFELNTNLSVPAQGVTAIYGPSGSGKTTFLRCLAGLEKPDEGKLVVQGDSWQSAEHFKPAHKRPVGYVFQEASLFPHLSAGGNLAYAMRRAATRVTDELYQQVLSVMGIDALLSRYPENLSGGERQRVAIARALLIRPRLLLMDEPLASLDRARKQEILPYLERLRTAFELPIIYVSHALEEVARLASHAVVLDQGRVVAEGGVNDVFSRIDLPGLQGPDTGVMLSGQVVSRDARWHLVDVRCLGSVLTVPDEGDHPGKDVRLRILASDVSLAQNAISEASVLNQIPVSVESVGNDQHPAHCLVRLRAGDDYLLARLTRRSFEHLQVRPGQTLWALIKSVAIIR
ncbi:molybdenum ABC transporter ATP-binding protein [Marinimicrobium sp. ARAG 43.8]|uniref:molybdenum ABC transporter ATP-binding protein n=1 Tax=Marinimicrobium sp. ARAG 43.8 TaxID=3418719 RepID=UPI003CF61BA6